MESSSSSCSAMPPSGPCGVKPHSRARSGMAPSSMPCPLPWRSDRPCPRGADAAEAAGSCIAGSGGPKPSSAPRSGIAPSAMTPKESPLPALPRLLRSPAASGGGWPTAKSLRSSCGGCLERFSLANDARASRRLVSTAQSSLKRCLASARLPAPPPRAVPMPASSNSPSLSASRSGMAGSALGQGSDCERVRGREELPGKAGPAVVGPVGAVHGGGRLLGGAPSGGLPRGRPRQASVWRPLATVESNSGSRWFPSKLTVCRGKPRLWPAWRCEASS
mmetsp:Transcript_92006/g.291900  ORF Transcript_92006/g.291900 Transcript_92006/m.291900 type:complete len:277 (-) Transcript_92006:1006-1836(-)